MAPCELLVGIPYNMDGSEGEMATEARRFGARLGELLGLTVTERDERLSSVEADRRMRDAGLAGGRRPRKGLRDRIAAAVMLEDYLSEAK